MTPISSYGQIALSGDYYLANDIVITSSSQLTNGAALYITAPSTVRINMNGKKIKGVGLSPNEVSYGVLAIVNGIGGLVLEDAQVGGVTGFWCGVQSDRAGTRIEQLVLSGNYNIGATLTGASAKAYYNFIDGIGGETIDPYNTGLNISGGDYVVRGNVIRNLYKQGSGVGEGVPIILSASSSGGICERNFLENDSEQGGTIGIFAGSGGPSTIRGNVITGFKTALMGGGTAASPMTATGNTLRLRADLAGSVGFSVAYGLVEDNAILNYDTPILPGCPTGSGNTIYP